MFRKTVTESAYSPALAANLSSYVRQLRSEVSRRQIGLIFVLLAIVVQLFATLLPPESANANNPEVFIDGGIQSVDEYLRYYDENTENVKDLLTSLGINRLSLETAIPTSLQSAEDTSIWFTQNTRSSPDRAHHFQAANGDNRVAYHRPMNEPAAPIAAYVGSAPSTGWFAILKDSGNLAVRTSAIADCNPWYSISESGTHQSGNIACYPDIESSVSARAVSSGHARALDKTKPFDRIAYTLSINNTGNMDITVPVTVSIEDILEYAQLFDRGGGNFTAYAKKLSWPEVSLTAGETVTRNFIVQILPTIPSTARGSYITSSYDCSLDLTFGNTSSIPVACPIAKNIEQLTSNLPNLSVKANLTFAVSLLVTVLYLSLRSKQLLHEIYVIRHNHLGDL